MTNDDRDARIIEMHADMKCVKELAIRHDHSLYGNGRPGLCQRMEQLEIQQRDCPARAALGDSARGNRIAAWALVVSVLTAAATAIIGAFKP